MEVETRDVRRLEKRAKAGLQRVLNVMKRHLDSIGSNNSRASGMKD